MYSISNYLNFFFSKTFTNKTPVTVWTLQRKTKTHGLQHVKFCKL